MKNLIKYSTIILLLLLAVSCNKSDDDTENFIPENEKLLKSVSGPDNITFNYEYNSDKTVHTIVMALNENTHQKFSLEYTKGNLTTLNSWGNNGIQIIAYTYDADNRITSFKKGNNPIILVDYFDDLNRYVWREENYKMEIRLNAKGDMVMYSKKRDGDADDPVSFLYDDAKKGAFSNSKTIVPQLLMIGEIGSFFIYAGGMTYNPLAFFGSETNGNTFHNQHDSQGFISKTNAGSAEFEFEYFRQ